MAGELVERDGFPKDDETFVRLAYRYLLQRDVDPEGLEHYVGKLAGGAERQAVIRDFVESSEFDAIANRRSVQPEIVSSLDYSGQLAEKAQADLRSASLELTPADCEFYHTMELPDGEVHRGAWDLRNRETAYLGGIELDHARVLELGPTYGHLTFWMESQGAKVVGFEAGFDRTVDVVPSLRKDSEGFRRSIARTVQRVNNSWWYSHSRLSSSSTMVYGDVYCLPPDLGEFDVAIFGSILLHLERPLRALAAAAERSKTLVVCEPLGPFAATADEKLMRPLPASDRNLTGWWQIAPGALVDMLEILGFGDFELTSHRQRHHVEHDVSSEQVDVDMYTLVARKNTDQ